MRSARVASPARDRTSSAASRTRLKSRPVCGLPARMRLRRESAWASHTSPLPTRRGICSIEPPRWRRRKKVRTIKSRSTLSSATCSRPSLARKPAVRDVGRSQADPGSREREVGVRVGRSRRQHAHVRTRRATLTDKAQGGPHPDERRAAVAYARLLAPTRGRARPAYRPRSASESGRQRADGLGLSAG